MPNWCENTLTVEGAETDVQRFKQLAKPKATQADVDLSLASLYPISTDAQCLLYVLAPSPIYSVPMLSLP